MSEAHGVLTDPLRRRTYDLCLASGRSLRYEPDKLDERIRNEFDLCKTNSGRLSVIESLFARLNGNWHEATEHLKEARLAEPANEALKKRLASVHKVSCLVQVVGTPNDAKGSVS